MRPCKRQMKSEQIPSTSHLLAPFERVPGICRQGKRSLVLPSCWKWMLAKIWELQIRGGHECRRLGAACRLLVCWEPRWRNGPPWPTTYKQSQVIYAAGDALSLLGLHFCFCNIVLFKYIVGAEVVESQQSAHHASLRTWVLSQDPYKNQSRVTGI